MASRRPISQYNVEMYQENMADDDQEMYMDGDEYNEEYEEEYVQLADGSLVRAASNEAGESQGVSYPVVNSYADQPATTHQISSSHPNTVYTVRKPQMYRVKTEENAAPRPQLYKYVKSATPVLREDKHIPQMHVQHVHQAPSQAYHVVHQPSVSYAYDTSHTTSATTTNHHQAYSYTPKSFELKQVKPNKRKAVAGQRKPCNCTKSMCLKLYCDCFANGEFCRDCNCKDCRNNLEFEADRTKAIKQSLERNPNAFKPKIGVAKAGTSQQDVERLHQKGCHCKKSGCLKNYCECYEAKVPCTDRCKCKGCQNTESDRAVRFKDKLPGSTLLGALSGGLLPSTSHPPKVRSANDSDNESDNEPDSSDPRGYPWFYMTDEVIDAATMCMVAQADEALAKNDQPNTEELERLILREFGRCLEQIITSTAIPPAV